MFRSCQTVYGMFRDKKPAIDEMKAGDSENLKDFMANLTEKQNEVIDQINADNLQTLKALIYNFTGKQNEQGNHW